MKRNHCELEDEILRLTQAAGISDAARRHLMECEVCRNTVAADAFVREFAAQPIEERRLPDATLIWLKAQLLQSDGAIFQLRQSLSIVHTIAFGLVALAWALLLSWKWTALSAFFTHAADMGAIVSALHAQLFSIPFVLTIIVLSCATVGLAFHSAMAE